MSKSIAAIRSVEARGLVVPIGRPVKTAFTTIDAAPLVLIDVETDHGVTGYRREHSVCWWSRQYIIRLRYPHW